MGLKDKSDPESAFLGLITTIEEHKVTLRGINRAGEWVPGRHDHLYKDIAMITFDGGYETALASVVR